jgi:hypothetical protein
VGSTLLCNHPKSWFKKTSLIENLRYRLKRKVSSESAYLHCFEITFCFYLESVESTCRSMIQLSTFFLLDRRFSLLKLQSIGFPKNTNTKNWHPQQRKYKYKVLAAMKNFIRQVDAFPRVLGKIELFIQNFLFNKLGAYVNFGFKNIFAENICVFC